MTPEAFDVLGAGIVEGRAVSPTDRSDAPSVAVINESFARRIWEGESAIGRTFTHAFGAGEIRVVGVVRDMAVTDLVGEQPMTAYYPWDQSERGSAAAIVIAKASSGDPLALAAPLRSLMNELDASAAIGRVATLEEVLDAEMAEALRLRFFLGLFSVLGMVLGSVGVYGVVSYSVQRRRAEFGIRRALGAERAALLGSVLGTGLAPVALGVGAGTLVALFSSTLLSRFLFEVAPVDPVSMLVAAGALMGAGVVAALLPALRASATPPAVALRAE
jgi:ABC-type antimicrobial peptide transport system permease subunit